VVIADAVITEVVVTEAVDADVDACVRGPTNTPADSDAHVSDRWDSCGDGGDERVASASPPRRSRRGGDTAATVGPGDSGAVTDVAVTNPVITDVGVADAVITDVVVADAVIAGVVVADAEMRSSLMRSESSLSGHRWCGSPPSAPPRSRMVAVAV
jgi:hypothetical protein